MTHSQVLNVLSVAHVCAAAVASLHVVWFHPQARGAALWLGIVWLVPWAGPLLYLLVGINRVPRRVQARGELTGAPPVWSEGNRIAILEGGDAAYAAMLAAIDAAESTVQLESFIFNGDRAGQLFCDALRRAASRGVETRVLIDAIGARYSYPSVVGQLRAGGTTVALFLPTTMPWRWPYANMRNHRKLLVLDGARAFVGGMNIREACMLSLEPEEPTLDTHFLVEGPIVRDIDRLFAADWTFATGDRLASVRAVDAIGATSARLVVGGPDRQEAPIRWLKVATLVRAARRVRIVTPYFVPDEDVTTAICAAAMAGVAIQIVLPQHGNLRVLAWASRATWPRLLEMGVEIVLTPPPFDHSKLMVVDDDLALVGSANWDERSFRLNFEADLECRDPDFVQELDRLIDRRVERGRRLTPADLQADPLVDRWRDRVAHLFLPYL